MVYLYIMRNKFLSNFAYRVDLFLRICFQILVLFIQIPIWRAVLKSNSEFEEMVTYVVVSTLISSMTASGVIEKINQKIKSGEIAMDLIKPLNFLKYMFFDNLGDNLFKFIFELVPILIVSVLLFDISVPSFKTLLLFLFSCLLGFLINFELNLVLGFIAFWYFSVWHLARLLEDLIKLFGGSIIPLWFFPNAFYAIANVLPFKYIFYVPITIFLEKQASNVSYLMVALQVVWCVGIYCLVLLVWFKGKKKIVIQGG